AVSIWRRRRNRPGLSCWFAYAVILAWVLSLIAIIMAFLAGPIEGNGANSEALGALYSLLIVLAAAPLHLALIAFGRALPDHRDPFQ
ncbi:MAG TPA: hypothetical protein VGR92_06385, partial [Steroidobacteraceae bacterium]|nr:hypothetical protein [Steroidobacteraceae bacterium]